MKFLKHIPILLSLSVASHIQAKPKTMLEKLNETIPAKNKEECGKQNGYWYAGKCWKNFKHFDDGIDAADIDRFVDAELKLAEKFKITIDKKSYSIDSFEVEELEDKDLLVFIVNYTADKQEKTLLLMSKIDDADKKVFKSTAVLIPSSVLEKEDSLKKILNISKIKGNFEATIISRRNSHLKFVGSMNNLDTKKKSNIQLEVGELSGWGDSTLEVKGDKAYLNGDLGTNGYVQFRNLIKNHPNVKTIVLQDVPGSINDSVNMHTGRIIREAGLTTMVEPNSRISSGGVDLFCAGKERIVHEGAKLGIHSWGGFGISADELPKDHPAHQYQLEYFTMCLGKTVGPKFYFRTLSAAPAGEMHWMSDKEVKEKVATKFIAK